MSAVNVTDLLAVRQELASALERLDAAIAGTGAAVVDTIKGKKAKKAERKPSARKGHGTAWSDFTQKLLKEHGEEVKAYKEANPEKKGAHLSFCAEYKTAHKEEWAAFEAAWKEAHPKPEAGADSASEAGSSGSDSESAAGAGAAEKPKRVLSEEQKRKMQEGRQKKKAEKEAAKAAEEAAAREDAPAPLPEPAAAAPAAAKKAPKKAEKAAPAPAPAPAPPAEEAEEDEEEDGPEFQSFVLGKTKYFRLGNRRPDGSVIWAGDDLWENNKGSRGDYVGLLGEDGSIDTTAEEPLLE